MTIQIHGLESFSFCETKGLAKCFNALAFTDLPYIPDVMDGGIGFNANSGYVYIALEEGITIASKKRKKKKKKKKKQHPKSLRLYCLKVQSLKHILQHVLIMR